MQFQISPSSLEKLQAELPRLSPWMHAFSFNDTIYTGYYKNTGQNKTYWTTEDSNLAIVKSLFNEYMSKRPFYHMDYLLNYFGERKSKIRALDIASATGRFSFYLAGQGVGQVKGVEIRAE